jgi:hypothetical protein
VSDLFNPVPINIAHQRQISAHSFMINSLEDLIRFIRISKGIIPSPLLQPQLMQQFLDALCLSSGLISNSISQLDKSVLDQVRSEMVALSNLSVRFVAPLMPEKSESGEREKVRVKVLLYYSDQSWCLPFRTSLRPSSNG